MKISEALPLLRQVARVPFGDLLQPEDMRDLRTNKGIVGKLLEKHIGLPNSTALLDFEDGELKTNKAHPNGKPRETIAISQISKKIDYLLMGGSFAESWLYEKIRHLVYLPVVKEGPQQGWHFLPPIEVRLEPEGNIYRQLQADYQHIINTVQQQVHTGDRRLHTVSGTFLQIRTKDSKPYHPIFSEKLGRQVSDKNFAFYFKKDFMLHLLQNSEDYPDFT